MKKLLLIGLFSLVSLNAYAQDEENGTYNGEKYGYIINKAGKKLKGLCICMAAIPARGKTS
ncbi:hypothetical protein OWR28_13160 [Chryseobacterium sp. 1B4]